MGKFKYCSLFPDYEDIDYVKFIILTVTKWLKTLTGRRTVYSAIARQRRSVYVPEKSACTNREAVASAAFGVLFKVYSRVRWTSCREGQELSGWRNVGTMLQGRHNRLRRLHARCREMETALEALVKSIVGV
jgi:hypothetical protein